MKYTPRSLQKGFAPLLVLVVLAVFGLAVGVNLVKKGTNFFNRASNTALPPCGGFEGILCADGYICVSESGKKEAPRPDALGVCVPVSNKTCPSLTPPSPDFCKDGTVSTEIINGCPSFTCFPNRPVPTSACIPRPPCLDANPRCLISEPISGWCSGEETEVEVLATISPSTPAVTSSLPIPTTKPTVKPEATPIVIEPLSGCKEYWWFDEKEKYCHPKKEFCGAFMYNGLRVYATEGQCWETLAAVSAIATPVPPVQVQIPQILELPPMVQRAVEVIPPTVIERIISVFTRISSFFR